MTHFGFSCVFQVSECHSFHGKCVSGSRKPCHTASSVISAFFFLLAPEQDWWKRHYAPGYITFLGLYSHNNVTFSHCLTFVTSQGNDCHLCDRGSSTCLTNVLCRIYRGSMITNRCWLHETSTEHQTTLLGDRTFNCHNASGPEIWCRISREYT